MMSKFFIEHPILANVIAIITILLGVVCLVRLPVAEYPEIVPPTIRVSTSYPGASADVRCARFTRFGRWRTSSTCTS